MVSNITITIIDGIKKLSLPKIIEQIIVDIKPIYVGRCSLLDRYCSTTTLINKAVIENSIPLELNLIIVASIDPNKVPNTQ